MDKIQIYITEEELDSIVNMFIAVEFEYGLRGDDLILFEKLRDLECNWDIELRKENLKELKRCLSPQED